MEKPFKQLNPSDQLSEELLEYVYSILEIYDGKVAGEKGFKDG